MTRDHSMPRAFIFDCDGTILQSMGMWLRVEPALLKTYGIDTVSDDFAEFESLSVADECEAYHRKWGVGKDGVEVYERLLGMLARGYAEEVTARDGVIDFLRSAHEAGIPMAIATSTPAESVRIGLDAFGVGAYFDAIVTTADAGASKDHPDVYNLALQKLIDIHDMKDVDHDDVWIFEDMPFGLISSGSAGYRRVGIFDPEGRATRACVQENCDIFIDSFTELSLDSVLFYTD